MSVCAARNGKAWLVGGRYSFDPRKDEWFSWEEGLRAEVRAENGPDEIIAMKQAGTAPSLQTIVLPVGGGKAAITRQMASSHEAVRKLSADEIEDVRRLLRSVEFDQLPPLIFVSGKGGIGHALIAETEFIYVSKRGGRRVFTNTVYVDREGRTPHQRIYNLIRRLMDVQ